MNIPQTIQETEQKFEAVKNSIDIINQELQKHGASTINDLEVELVKLQGEYRVLSKLDPKPLKKEK